MQGWADILRQQSDGQKGVPNLEVGRYAGEMDIGNGRGCVPHRQGEAAGT